MEEIKKKIFEANRSRQGAGAAMSGLEFGKLQPQAVDLEEAVLGAMLLEKDAVNQAIDILTAEAFYKDAHRFIFEAIAKLFQKSEPIDILTVTQELRKEGKLDIVGGAFYISQLTNKVASSANVEFHARIVVQKYIQRELIKVSGETIKMAYEETTDVFDLLDKAESDLFAVTQGNIRKNYDSIDKLLKQAITQIETISKTPGGISGVPSGFTALDRVTSGFQKSDLIVLAARPGMGKTAFVLSLARNSAVEHNTPVAVFSLEMSSIQLVNRLIASETEISADKLKKGNLEQHEWQQLLTRITRLSEAKIFIDDTPALSVFELRAKCRRLKQQHDIKMVIVDYLQLMTVGGEGRGGVREQEISTISRSLKSIAKELDLPIIALSQLSRNVETRGGLKKPMLSDLRESGAIEQDADMVMFIWRPGYYQLTEDEQGNAFEDDYAELLIAKHRNGALEDVPVRFIGKLAKFSDFDRGNFTSSSLSSDDSDFTAAHPFATPPQHMVRSSKMDDIIEDDWKLPNNRNMPPSNFMNDENEPPF